MEYTIREMTVMEYPLLNEFLYEAIFIPDGIKPPPKKYYRFSRITNLC